MGKHIYFVIREKGHIIRYPSDPYNAKIARYASDTESIKFILYYRVDKKTTQTRN